MEGILVTKLWLKQPESTFCLKRKERKTTATIKLGPGWDFDWNTHEDVRGLSYGSVVHLTLMPVHYDHISHAYPGSLSVWLLPADTHFSQQRIACHRLAYIWNRISGSRMPLIADSWVGRQSKNRWSNGCAFARLHALDEGVILMSMHGSHTMRRSSSLQKLITIIIGIISVTSSDDYIVCLSLWSKISITCLSTDQNKWSDVSYFNNDDQTRCCLLIHQSINLPDFMIIQSADAPIPEDRQESADSGNKMNRHNCEQLPIRCTTNGIRKLVLQVDWE